MAKLVKAITPFATRERMVHSGEVFAANDPIVKGREALFGPVDESVEQATAAPGEKRTTRRPKAEDAEA
jgi:hypothetical protein